MLKTNIRIWIIVIVLFIVLDLILRNFLYLTVNENNLRPVKKDILSIDLIADKIHHDKKSKIAFLGDSQMYGSAVSTESETVPGHLRDLLNTDSLHVYNLGGKGYGPGEVYYQLQHLKNEKFNVIIYNVSLGWLDRSNLTELIGIGALNGVSPLEANDRQRDMWEYSRDITHDLWYLRGHRYYLGDLVKGELGLAIPADLELKKTYNKWSKEQIVKKLKNTNYTTKIINQENLKMLDEVFNQLDAYTARGTRVIIYISPQNIELFDKANLWNQSFVSRNITLVKDLTVKHKFDFYNNINIIPGKYFVDTIHMDNQGNDLLAHSLFKDLNIPRRAK